MQLQQRSARGHEARERGGARGAERQMAVAEFAEQELEDLQLDAGDAPVIDMRGLSKLLQSRCEPGLADSRDRLRTLRTLAYCRHRDVQHVEEVPVRGAVGAGPLRLGGRERVQR